MNDFATDDAQQRPARAAGLLRAGAIRSLAPFLARYPTLPATRLLGDAGIDPQSSDPNGWVSVRRCANLLETASELSNDSGFALAFAEQLPWGDLGVLSYLVLNSPTLGAALANACRYFGVQSTGAGAQLEVEGNDAFVRYGMHDPTVATHAQNTEMVFTLFTRVCRDGLGDASWAPRAIHFKHARPSSTSKQRALFRCPLVFDQELDALIIAPEDLRRPLRRADGGLLSILIPQANACLPSGFEDGFHDHVRSVVMASLRSGEVTIEHVAARLGTSARTIQRRLQDRGRSFKDLVADTRLALSRRYLEDSSMSLTDAAFLLGYSDLSAFSRAFRRWTGQSALAFRRSASAKPPTSR